MFERGGKKKEKRLGRHALLFGELHRHQSEHQNTKTPTNNRYLAWKGLWLTFFLVHVSEGVEFWSANHT